MVNNSTKQENLKNRFLSPRNFEWQKIQQKKYAISRNLRDWIIRTLIKMKNNKNLRWDKIRLTICASVSNSIVVICCSLSKHSSDSPGADSFIETLS